MVFAPRVAFVDVETTGARVGEDRVTEIGILRVIDGQIESEWASLVDPGIPIPPAIQRFTGITDEMVRGAPRFAQLADELFERLAGCLFVAHNARFDLGFLRTEFARLDMAFRPPVLCTVKLSRALYPGAHRHGLDALIARHSLSCEARHRALGDARVLWDFARLAAREHPADTFQAAIAKAMKAPRLPGALEAGVLEALPESPGVYFCYGEGGRLLHVGHASKLRSELWSRFSADRGAWIRLTRQLDWIETAGTLGAAIRVLEAIRARRPQFNRLPAPPPAAFRIPPWPYGGPVAVREQTTECEREELHVIDRWCYLGRARDPDEVHGLLSGGADRSFDPDVFRLLRRFLARPATQVLPLASIDA